MFPSKEDAIHDLVHLTPMFLAKLDRTNLEARGVRTVADYLKSYHGQLRVFSDEEKHRLASLTEAARKRCASSENLRHLVQIEWKLAKSSDTLENGFPHTVGGVIVIPHQCMSWSDERLKQLLVHEATHLHQRAYPAMAEQHAAAMGFEAVRTWHANGEALRANPDTNMTIYSLKSWECNPVFANPSMPHLGDVVLKPMPGYPGWESIRNHEHVFEIAAEINEKLFSG